MDKKSAISNNSLPGSSTPSISRSSINHCSFNGLNAADSIHRSELDSVNVFRKTFPESSRVTSISPANTTIRRSKVSHTVIANSYVRRCKLANCELIDVCSAKSLDANDSKFDNVRSIRGHTSVRNSTVTGQSTLNRSKVNGSSVTDESCLRRSHIEDVRIARSRVKRSELRNCDVSDCVIIKTNFTDMILRYGVWKNGKLVGRVGDNEVVMMTQDGQNIGHVPSERLVTQDAKVWADDDPDSDSSDKESLDSDDLPPPYKP
ncbi:hypothetical protein F9C07_107 [Aspergillus flavus]|uniref:Uncharacterized protein n=1 Tax=Aspergillus flavus (strain ATCC 200026 / FGSC A1120 / IAM 13836 / NRRL 3357 / JCM 12722 / SRRC 167) TaxID=332952 RepID=A0A7U2MNV7_ASPFN|nr:uncharacterized protein G4B84_001978 [Aspergillus flavus NRRL3357]KAF7627479.1 hypothetical protein AFLA_002860 [Aspergillus flavus NRRL3357]QMW26733.1 hypothetical protein G4B84_001978 [Aspergillus flavus NRRL3357]QRD87113.1 hypothetical protein F9C07_107 [Aspergillus flavus]